MGFSRQQRTPLCTTNWSQMWRRRRADLLLVVKPSGPGLVPLSLPQGWGLVSGLRVGFVGGYHKPEPEVAVVLALPLQQWYIAVSWLLRPHGWYGSLDSQSEFL